ncbi:multiple monosaccharide ABC transporter substrate-binding protein [Heyndrickxia camelliae]|uniref:Sugar ABC transporter substrate-binding protein n=1 Tax=Heyndrickxia camelliae TaxID=1707093 RepID=A0A2N3LIX5_9BACI|nr:multiple monosaccharide ABC transporter substrate-binding protein [Heyndrickxia camelliae]PKR84578.1 sugar ABC transporter substrate-binding protein [Heyndrickxia camelliae]
MKRFISFMLLLTMIIALTACGSKTSGGKSGFVGISMPTKSSERWINDGNYMVKEFKKLGYKTDLQYGEDVVENQVSQIENMITKGVDVLVIAPIDGEALTNVLEEAHKQNIKVIAYDRLIKKSKYVDYYATFDNFKVGVIQGSYIEDKLGLKDGKGPFNIEIFAGSPDDNNAYFFFDGAMSVLKPYIDSGKLVVRSKQTKFEQAATLRWDGATAQARMDNLLSANYTTEKVDAVLSPYDGISIGVLSSLKGVGYGTASKPMPIVTGQDAELASVKSIIAGEQTQTVFKDTRELAKQAVKMANSVLKGKKADVNDTKTYDNGEKVVPAYLLQPVSVDKENYKDVLVDSGYYKEAELNK